MKNYRIKSMFLTIFLLCHTFFSTFAVGAAENWETLFKKRVQQIEGEYASNKRINDTEYNIRYYSLQDFNFDGIPELYHGLIAKRERGYEVQEGTEEIYYIKSGRVVLGKINSHETLGLLPSLSQNNELTDRTWQCAMYNGNTEKVEFVTKDSWSDSSDKGRVKFITLTFDLQKGILNATEFFNEEYMVGSEPSNPSGYMKVGDACTCSAQSFVDTKLWDWVAPYIYSDKKVENVVAKTWKDAYQSFVLGKQYKKNGQTFNDSKVEFSIFELDSDGIPELIVGNGIDSGNLACAYVYAYKSNKVTYVGKLDGIASNVRICSDPNYSGLYLETGDNGVFEGYYYEISNNKLIKKYVLKKTVIMENGRVIINTEAKTEDKSLFEICKLTTKKLILYNVTETNNMGWDAGLSNLSQEIALFDDVSMNDWYYDAVKFVIDKGVMSGVSAAKFEPNAEITRSMFVTMLYRLENEPKTSAVKFKDVPKDSWYEDAVSWASKKNIVTGVGKDTFAPDTKITREQLMTILYRYAKYKNKTIKTDEKNIKGFLDNNTVSEYAVIPMNWGVGNGFISGTSKDHLGPFELATRAQTAVILQRFCEKYKM